MKPSHTVLTLTLCALLTGCASHNNKMNETRDSVLQGDLDKSAALISDLSEKNKGGDDEILYLLEEGSIKRLNRNYTGSIKSFDMADRLIDENVLKADVSVSEEAGAMLTNQTFTEYKGYDYDRIMMNTYKAINYLSLAATDSREKNLRSARVELTRATMNLEEAITNNKKLVEAAREASDQANEDSSGNEKPSYDVTRAKENDKFNESMDQKYGYLDELSYYQDFVNPFTYYLTGLYLLHNPDDASDLEMANSYLGYVYKLIGEKKFINTDLQMVNSRLNGSPVEKNMTYVIFETGMAPEREETRIDIPLFLLNNEVDYVGVAFPDLEFNGEFSKKLSVNTGTNIYQTQLCADMDKIVAFEFKKRLPVVITKTLLSAGTKAMAQYLAKEATKENEVANLITRVGGTVYQAGMNRADLRTWTMLPKQIQVTSFETPPSGDVSLSAGNRSKEVELLPGKINVIYIKQLNNNAPLYSSQFTL